jgi:hypothetical protein
LPWLLFWGRIPYSIWWRSVKVRSSTRGTAEYQNGCMCSITGVLWLVQIRLIHENVPSRRFFKKFWISGNNCPVIITAAVAAALSTLPFGEVNNEDDLVNYIHGIIDSYSPNFKSFDRPTPNNNMLWTAGFILFYNIFIFLNSKKPFINWTWNFRRIFPILRICMER